MAFSSAFAIILIGMIVLLYVVLLGGLVAVSILGLWKLFTKAGVPGWMSLIPFANTYRLYQLAWNPTAASWAVAAQGGLVGLTLLYAVIGTAFGIGVQATRASAGGMIPLLVVLLLVLLLMIACGVVMLVLDIRMNIRLARAFGKPPAFAVGLILVPIVFRLIVGCDRSAVYYGPSGV